MGFENVSQSIKMRFINKTAIIHSSLVTWEDMKDLCLVQYGSRGTTKAIDVLMRKRDDTFVNLDLHTKKTKRYFF